MGRDFQAGFLVGNDRTNNTMMNGNGEDEDVQLCDLCNTPLNFSHKSTLSHRFNFELFGWAKYRKKLVQNRHGVEVHIRLVDVINGNALRYEEVPRKGSHVTKATVVQATLQTNGIAYLVTVKNILKSGSVFLMNARLLHPYDYFVLEDFSGQMNGQAILELEHGASYSFKIKFQPDSVVIGSYKMPVAIELQTAKDEAFTISREMVIIISDEEEVVMQPKGKSPFTRVIWQDVNEWHEPTKRVRAIEDYPIPSKYFRVIRLGLCECDNISYEELGKLHTIRHLLEPSYPTRENYRDFFHYVLWVDESGAELMLRRYNMENVTMTCLPRDTLELEVPGLAEKRPSLIAGDIVNIRVHLDHTAYKGIVCRVNDTTIWIEGVDIELTETIADDPGLELDVSFQLSRLHFERMHAAIDQCISNDLLGCLFPDPDLANRNVGTVHRIADHEFVDQNIVNNAEQKMAVENILNCKSGEAPYIVFGPPGTGKTVTIVEAIVQIKKRISNAKILVCAPANAACDMLALKLIQQHRMSTDELIRVHSSTRDWNTVPDDVKPYSNYADEGYTHPTGSDLMGFRVIITTLILIGRYAVNQKFYPDFVFIDEAAQAMEPEAAVAIAFLKPRKQLVLAGDPKQLGPQCASIAAEKFGLGVSLLERLMDTPLYASHNPNFITMLKLNFRAHPVVLQLPNELFYDNQLQAMSQSALRDPIANVFIYHKISPPKRNKLKKIQGQPVEFCAIFAKERREGRSPSYFNQTEVEMVLKYVKELINLTEAKVSPADIGIVTPYIRQVYRIKDRLSQNGYADVEVGTTEVFQGREKRIMIISTVRAQHSLLLHDRRYQLGFVKNEKRFNVALTRAMSKLIIIGCPNVLRYDQNWLRYIEFCENRQAYFGAQIDRRTDAVKADVIQRISGVHSTDPQYRRNNH